MDGPRKPGNRALRAMTDEASVGSHVPRGVRVNVRRVAVGQPNFIFGNASGSSGDHVMKIVKWAGVSQTHEGPAAPVISEAVRMKSNVTQGIVVQRRQLVEIGITVDTALRTR